MPTVCTLTGKFVDGTGLARTGRVTFVPTVRGVSSADDLILSLGTVVRVLDASGSFSVDLYRTDDASWAPSGWVWTVLEDMTGATGVTYAIELTSETANLADLSPVVVPDPYVSYVLQDTYDARTPADIGAATVADLAAPDVLGVFSPAGTEVALERASVSLYRMYQDLGSRRYWRTELRRLDTLASGPAPGSADAYALCRSSLVTPMIPLNDDVAAVTRAGSGWNQVTQPLAPGGNYYRTTTSGDSATWTTLDDTTKVALRYVGITNAGVIKVSIDGDATRANLLPTAQELVDTGVLASLGTLSATDRVINQYLPSANYARESVLADDLTPGVHVVVFTCTSEKQAASSDIRMYLTGLGYATSGTRLQTAGTERFVYTTLIESDSAWEYANSIKPAGASGYIFVGGYHGYEYQDALTFEMDGVAADPADGVFVYGESLKIARATRLRHDETGTTDVANVATNYTLDANGLGVQHSTTWNVAVSVAASYPAMYPVGHTVTNAYGSAGALFTTGTVDSLADAFEMTAHDGTFKGKVAGRVITMWQPVGSLACALYVPSTVETLNNFALSYFADQASLLTVQDNSVNTMAKAYAVRVATGNFEEVAAAAVWESDSTRRMAFLPNGANDALVNAATSAELDAEETARIAADDLRTLGVTDVVRTNTKLDGHSSNSIDANATQSIILGGGSDGYPNLISAAAALQTIVGGYNNDLRGALAGSILGSQHAIMDAASTHGCIAGGSFLSLYSADYSTALGGTQNVVGEPTIDTNYSAAIGGEYNAIYGSHSAILAGKTNTVGSVAQETYGQYSSLLGGLDNTLGTTANARFSGIVGGRENGVQAEYGGIVGSRGALVRYPGAVAQALGTFVSQGDAQTYTLVMRRSITGASLLQILIDDTYRLVLPDNASWMFEINVVGRRVDGGAAQSAAYRIVGAIKRGVGAGSTALMGTPTVTVIHEDNAAWDIDCLADATNGNLQIRASAAAGATVQYVAKVSIVETIEAV
jgi:hypothetical protein